MPITHPAAATCCASGTKYIRVYPKEARMFTMPTDEDTGCTSEPVKFCPFCGHEFKMKIPNNVGDKSTGGSNPMCSISDTTNSLKQSIKTLSAAVEKLEALPNQEKINHPLFHASLDIEEAMRTVHEQTAQEVSVPNQAHQSADAPAPAASA